MSTEQADSVRSIDTSRSTTSTPVVEAGRFDRAVREAMITERVADRLYRVTNVEDDGKGYDVDLETGACSCPDAEYRPEYVCKHAIRAALVEVFANTVSTELVARVVGYAREPDHGCPHGHDFCDGPVGPRLPCPGCMDAVRSEGVDEWVVWQRAVTEDRP